MQALYLTAQEATVDPLLPELPTFPTVVNYPQASHVLQLARECSMGGGLLTLQNVCPQWGALAMLPLSGPDYKAQVRASCCFANSLLQMQGVTSPLHHLTSHPCCAVCRGWEFKRVLRKRQEPCRATELLL